MDHDPCQPEAIANCEDSYKGAVTAPHTMLAVRQRQRMCYLTRIVSFLALIINGSQAGGSQKLVVGCHRRAGAEVLTHIRAIPTGGLPYLDFMAPGILAQSVLFIAIFSGIAIIWERDLGIVHKFLASPTPRTALVLGKALAARVRSLSQAIIIYLLALLLGVPISWNLLALLGVVALVLLGAACFSSFSLIIACLVKTRGRFMGIGQVLTMPLFFASNAIYPITIMPAWLQVIAHANPLTYEIDGLRALMLGRGMSGADLALDFGVLLGVTAALVVIGGWLYPKVVS